MTIKQQWAIVGAVVALMAAGLGAGSYFLRDELRQIAVGSTAPNFSAITVDDKPPQIKTLASYKGEVVLLNIWATWCLPCRREMPSIDSLYRDYASKGLKVVAVSVDEKDKVKDIREFVKEFNLSFEILHDTAKAIPQSYQTTGFPESFVIGRDGTIQKKWIGEENWNSAPNRRLVESLLAMPK